MSSGLTVPLLSAIAGLLLWWRGIIAGREPVIGYDVVYRGFGTGVVAWMGALIVAGSDGSRAGLGGGVLLFFLVSLSALALASLVSVQRRAHGEAGPGISRFWLVVVASVILTILTLGVLLSQVLVPELITQLLGLFRPIVNLLAQGLYFLLTAIAALVFIVLGPIIEFLRPRGPAAPLPTPQSDLFENFRREMERAAQGSQAPPGWVVTLVQALFVLALLVAVLFFLSRAFRRLRLLDSEGVEEMRESIGSWALLWAQLGALLRSCAACAFQWWLPAHFCRWRLFRVRRGGCLSAKSIGSCWRWHAGAAFPAPGRKRPMSMRGCWVRPLPRVRKKWRRSQRLTWPPAMARPRPRRGLSHESIGPGRRCSEEAIEFIRRGLCALLWPRGLVKDADHAAHVAGDLGRGCRHAGRHLAQQPD